MHDARDIARLLIAVGHDPDAPEESVLLCPMRLQKLLYYAQGWSLALLGRPLFRQPVEAWRHGPVVRDVYDQFKGRCEAIRPDEAGTPAAIGATDAELVRAVWAEFARYAPSQLRAMTHAEEPWLAARGGLADDAPSDAEIGTESMRAFFEGQFRKRGFDLQDLRDSWRLGESPESFPSVGLAEARSRRAAGAA